MRKTLRVMYLIGKWALVCLGAFLLISLFVDRWGWGTTIAICVVPFVSSFLNHLSGTKPPTP